MLGGYVLLRLKKYDLMHDWARNLAERFEAHSDGAVIWATQLSATQGQKAEVENYLRIAVSRGVPIFSEGLRLLLEHLRRMGPEGLKLEEGLAETVGFLVEDSPFTAGWKHSPSKSAGRWPDITFSFLSPA
jgi:hypothetical protein